MNRTFTVATVAVATALSLSLNPLTSIADTVSVTTGQGRRVVVRTITPDIIRVENYPAGTVPSATLTPSPASAPDTVKCASSTCGPLRIFTTPSGVTVRVNSITGAVDINAGVSRAVSDSGLRSLANGKQTLSLSTMGGGSFYGAGERGYSFNLAGDTLVMYNKQNYGYTGGENRIRQMNITMPLFLSSNGYAVVFDDYAAAEMVMANPVVYTTESTVPVSYYFVNSTGTLASLTEKLSSITGRQDLPPLWALGYITSKYGYRTQAETEGVVDTLKRAGYPVDGIVLDLYWYGKEQDMGRLDWDPGQWPDHKAMLTRLKKLGVNTVTISQPYVLRNGRGVSNYTTLTDGGMLLRDSTGAPQEVQIWVGEGGMLDVSNPDTRAWLRDRYRSLTLDGIGGWWGDLGEPEVHPETGLHANGLPVRLYHNRYGNDWSSIIYDLYREEFPDTRLMTLMRGGTTGLQQYSVFPWSTDVSRSWGGLQPQITIMLNSGLSGLGYMSHDVGGFAIDENNPYDPELYVRWLQLGTFSPVLRTHSQRSAEPYCYPDHQDIILPLIKERYRWLPYNYTLAWENASKGLPLVRPLNFYTSGSNLLDDITDQYLWGRDVLVAPVLTPGATSRSIVFPVDGSDWVDLADPSRVYHSGDTILSYPAPLDVLPLFVRAGSFIPTADYDMANTGEYRTERYTINYYPTFGKSTSTLYEDDLVSTTSIKDGAYRLITFEGDASSETIDIRITTEGNLTIPKGGTLLTFKIHRTDSRPSSVTVNGKNTKAWKYDPATSTLSLPVPLYSSPLSIRIAL